LFKKSQAGTVLTQGIAMAAMQLWSCSRSEAGTETPDLLERRTRAGHRSLKQGQLEVVGRGRPLLRTTGGPTIKDSDRNCVLARYGQKGPLLEL